ncbi:MAG: hypothetical protein ACRED5_06900 [Propylenella sp.]
MTAETAETHGPARSSFVDSIWMRLIALLVGVAGIALFVYVNQDMLAERLAGRSSGEASPYQQCLDERMAAVEAMAREANYTAKQKELAEIRAREFCRNETGS